MDSPLQSLPLFMLGPITIMPAVMVPSFAKAGLSVGIFAASAVSGCSSCTTSTAPFRPGALTATISGAKLPSSTAFFARFSDSIA